jgi:hypothetical protein
VRAPPYQRRQSQGHDGSREPVRRQAGKTDKLDAAGLATLLHNGTLPTVWLPPSSVRDERELPRTRMALSRIRTIFKNRIHATLAKYALSPDDEEISDLFSKKGRIWLEEAANSLPPQTGRCLAQQLELVNHLDDQIGILETRMREQIQTTINMQLLKTLPGIGDILAAVFEREVGSIDRFRSPEQLAAYSGTTPKVSASLSWRTRPGRRKDPLRSNAPGGQPLLEVGLDRLSWPDRPGKPAISLRSIMPRQPGNASTSHDSTIESKGRKATQSRSVRWPAISPRQRTGCSPSRNPTRSRNRPGQGSGKREKRMCP